MNQMVKQSIRVIRAMKGRQKIILSSALLLLFGFFSLLLTRSYYTPINQDLGKEELKKIEEFLDTSQIKYKTLSDNQLLVAKEQKVVAEEKVSTFLQEGRHAGFELFDSNTWIKGEKELQILEMRALKGQLEKDLARFEAIREATVILDLAPQKLFNSGSYKTKASVILLLKEEAELSHSQLSAIAYHLSGAVRGLEPNRIAISDSTGKLYKAIHEEGEDLFFQSQERNEEEVILEKITKLLQKVLGKGRFHLNVIRGEPHRVALMVEDVTPALQQALEHQITTLLGGNSLIAIDALPSTAPLVKERPPSFIALVLTALLFLFLGGVVAFFLSRPTKVVAQKGQEKVDVQKLAKQIEQENPKIIALMLSYLEAEKAEKLLFSLPYHVQKKVALHLPGLQSEDL